MRFSLFRSTVLLAALALGGAAFAETPKLILGRYEGALKLMDQGQCEKAKDMLFPGGKVPAGEEVAISDLGDCYLVAAKKASDADEARRDQELGAGWIMRAASLNIREAQATVVKLYLDNQIFFADPYEAVKWYLVWQNNRTQMQLGQIEFDNDLSKQLKAFNADVWAEGKARAAQWRPFILKVESPEGGAP